MVLWKFSVYTYEVLTIEEIPEPTDDTVAKPVPFHFDLAPSAWTSELLAAAEVGRAEVPWVSWHPDRVTLMVVVGDGRTLTAARLRPTDVGLGVLEASVCSQQSERSFDLGAVPAMLTEATDLAERFLRLMEMIELDVATWRTSARGAGSRRPDVAYAALAARYVQLVSGGERHPAKALGAELGLSPVTVSQRIRECRNAPLELLTEATHGAAGGMLTDKAKRILARLEDS